MPVDMTHIFGSNIQRRAFFLLFVLSGLACLMATSLHYTNTYPGNPVTWAGWLLSVVFLLLTYSPTLQDVKEWLKSLNSLFLWVMVSLAVFFVVSHLWNFSTAPWNQHGLFDDAAWDIYFAKRYIFTDEPFQAAFLDGIAREVFFHYYITFFFKIFGYNLLTFNGSLILLGLTTFFFTSLIIHKIFNSYYVTIASAVIFNFLPTHYVQTFVGHRYAIAAPLIMASFYFLYTGFKNSSYFRVALSSVLAALCIESAIMGKHYVAALFVAMVLYLIFDYKKAFTPANRNCVIVFGLGLFMVLTPMIGYVYYNSATYFGHEQGLTQKFLESFGKSGPDGFKQLYVDNLTGIFFSAHSGHRFWTPDFVLIPFVYYIFLIPGTFIAIYRKAYAVLLPASIPVLGALVSTAYDFRVLHATPFWIILMAFSFSELVRIQNIQIIRQYARFNGVLLASAVVLLFGLVPSISWIHSRSIDPFSIGLLPQRDVAVSRFLRDIVAGVPSPSAAMRPNEFNKLEGLPAPNYEVLACQDAGYAITHLFLKDYDDNKIMSFCRQHPMRNLTDAEILENNKLSIAANATGDKNIKLVWEKSERTKRIIEVFKKFKSLGSEEILTSQHAGRSFSLYVLTIPKKNVAQLKQGVQSLALP